MLKAAKRGELFYVHDTHVNLGYAEVYDHRQHRDLFANMAKRSRYFMVGAAKMDALDERRGQVEVAYRYYEGAAAGTVMIGEAPDCEAYRELFGWPEAVIQAQPDGSDIMAVLSSPPGFGRPTGHETFATLLPRRRHQRSVMPWCDRLGSDPERTAAIGRRNAKEALLQHDWVYRWNEMFRVAGIKPSPGHGGAGAAPEGHGRRCGRSDVFCRMRKLGALAP
jgi:hypothetical protein